jgi:hypothetical protein
MRLVNANSNRKPVTKRRGQFFELFEVRCHYDRIPRRGSHDFSRLRILPASRVVGIGHSEQQTKYVARSTIDFVDYQSSTPDAVTSPRSNGGTFEPFPRVGTGGAPRSGHFRTRDVLCAYEPFDNVGRYAKAESRVRLSGSGRTVENHSVNSRCSDFCKVSPALAQYNFTI